MSELGPTSRDTALAPGDAAPWQDLPPEILPHILARLLINDVPCTARLACKAAAAALSSPEHTTVRLSQPSPHGEFVRRWGAPGAMRPLTLNRRRRLLALTAASGCLHNLAWLAERIGCSPNDSVLEAAAAAGRLDACRWLLQQGYGGLPAALAAAAGAGQRSTLEALLADPGAQDLSAEVLARLASCAARGGHVGLMDWLLERFGPSGALAWWDKGAGWDLLAAAAAGCDLATLQRLHFARQSPMFRPHQARPYRFCSLLTCAAASSRTPDWRAKVEWVVAYFRSRTSLFFDACPGAAACPDALERLAWLRTYGCRFDWRVVTSAAGAGNVEALSCLLADGRVVQPSAFNALRTAAAGGHLAALEVLRSHGLAATYPRAWAPAAAAAAREGQLAVVRWMLERQLIELQPPYADGENAPDNPLLGAAAASGSVELLTLLRAGDCPWGWLDLHAAAGGGSEEVLEWAAAVQGCPVQKRYDEDEDEHEDLDYFDPYLKAAVQGDWGTLACLRRLAVPWLPLNRGGGTFTCAVKRGCSVPILHRLLELGCPVDWLRAAAESRDDNVRAWLKEEEERRREVEGAPPQQ